MSRATLRLVPNGHATFDVFRGRRHAGSVWRTKGGWIPRTPSLLYLSRPEYPTAREAAESLR